MHLLGQDIRRENCMFAWLYTKFLPFYINYVNIKLKREYWEMKIRIETS